MSVSCVSFAESLVKARSSGYFPVICDIKRRSPQEGDLMGSISPSDLAVALVEAGAPALSVVTEPRYFGGSPLLLETVARAVNVPVLCKDFVNSVEQLRIFREAGANAILLIAAHLPIDRLVLLHKEAHNLGLETVVEVHSSEELRQVASLDLDCLGINNRDIRQLELDAGTVANTESLAALAPVGAVIISESGIQSPGDVRRAAKAGATAVLVGTAILKAADPVAYWRSLARALK